MAFNSQETSSSSSTEFYPSKNSSLDGRIQLHISTVPETPENDDESLSTSDSNSLDQQRDLGSKGLPLHQQDQQQLPNKSLKAFIESTSSVDCSNTVTTWEDHMEDKMQEMEESFLQSLKDSKKRQIELETKLSEQSKLLESLLVNVATSVVASPTSSSTTKRLPESDEATSKEIYQQNKGAVQHARIQPLFVDGDEKMAASSDQDIVEEPRKGLSSMFPQLSIVPPLSQFSSSRPSSQLKTKPLPPSNTASAKSSGPVTQVLWKENLDLRKTIEDLELKLSMSSREHTTLLRTASTGTLADTDDSSCASLFSESATEEAKLLHQEIHRHKVSKTLLWKENMELHKAIQDLKAEIASEEKAGIAPEGVSEKVPETNHEPEEVELPQGQNPVSKILWKENLTLRKSIDKLKRSITNMEQENQRQKDKILSDQNEYTSRLTQMQEQHKEQMDELQDMLDTAIQMSDVKESAFEVENRRLNKELEVLKLKYAKMKRRVHEVKADRDSLACEIQRLKRDFTELREDVWEGGMLRL